MNWDAIQAIAEVIAAIAVIGSLGYLALQVRQNTNSIQASTVARTSEVMNRLRHSVWTDQEAARIYESALTGVQASDSVEATRLRMFFAAIGRDYEAIYFQYQSHQLPEKIWKGWHDEMLLVFGTPGGRDAIKGLRAGFLTAEFADYIENELAKIEGSPLSALREQWESARQSRIKSENQE